MPFEPVYGVPHGRMRAAQNGGGILNHDCDEILRDFYRFKEKDARAAFADSWVRLTSQQLDKTWVVLYELLNIIRDQRLFENPKYMADGKARSSFEEYWDQIVEKPFETWAELEATYQFAVEFSPELLQKPFGEAVAKVKELAEKTEPTGTQGGAREGAGRPSKNLESVASVAQVAISKEIQGTNGTLNSKEHQKRPSRTSSEHLTARIARDRPDILERMKAGEFPSVRKAALEARIIKPEFSCPLEPHAAACRILNRFKGEPLLELIRILANHAGYDIVHRQ